jgi:hypothetical protein
MYERTDPSMTGRAPDLDRNNASAARLHGFERDLNLTGSQFASVLSILYVGYLVMQIPSYGTPT